MLRGRELQTTRQLVNCSKWLDLRPRNSSSWALFLSLVLSVTWYQQTAGVTCQQWWRLLNSRLPSMLVPSCVETCKLVSHRELVLDRQEASEVCEAPVWLWAFWMAYSFFSKHYCHHAASRCSSQDGDEGMYQCLCSVRHQRRSDESELT